MRIGRFKKAAALCALALACLLPAFGASAAAEPIKIGAIFAVTGPAAYLGAPEEKTARMVVDEVNKKLLPYQRISKVTVLRERLAETTKKTVKRFAVAKG